jgi:hypothetical protein
LGDFLRGKWVKFLVSLDVVIFHFLLDRTGSALEWAGVYSLPSLVI